MLPVHPFRRPLHLASRRMAYAVVGVVTAFGGMTLLAGDAPLASIVSKEIARRNARMQEARALITEGGLLYANGDYEQAARAYRQAWDVLPDSPMSAELKIQARDGYSLAAVAQAEKLAATGRYTEARALLSSVLAEDFDPENKSALVLQKRLDDPDRYEPALTPQHVENVAQVEKELRLGYGFTTLGDYNSAIAAYNRVLLIDPYNQAARRGMERAEQLKSEYFDAARDHRRAKMLAGVDEAWEERIPVTDVAALFGAGGMGILGGAKENLLTKIRTMIIPLVDLQGASLEEVVEFLRVRSRELDPLKRGVSFVLKVTPDLASKPVSMTMVSVPMEEVLRYVTDMTGTVYRADEYAITITSRAEKSGTIITRSYRVPPGFLENAPATPAAAAPADPFAAGKTGNAPGFAGLQIHRMGAREFLEQRGVLFPEGASASYTPGANLLIVNNTAENLTLVDSLVEDAASAGPKQVEIQVKMIEVGEERLQELGFDWLMGAFNVPGSAKVFGSGGTVGNQSTNPPGAGDFPFATPGSLGPTGNIPVGINPITAGLRSSGAILGKPSIDGLLGHVQTPAIDSRSPGAFAVAGVFTDPQFQVVLRALSQSKGVDLMAAPTIVAKSGQRANISIVREFIYPTEFDPPQIPQTIGVLPGGLFGAPGFIVQVTAPSINPVTPSTPTAFEKRDVGMSLEVEPVISADNTTVDLNLAPSDVEFEGFIDYGSPIKFTGSEAPTDEIATPNHIFQPVFRTNKVTTSVSVWDGNTIVIGGVMYETKEDIKDKVPILGSIPILGRAFSSKVSRLKRKNVIFFVSTRVIDPSGNPVHPPAAPSAAASR